jgi:phytoene desaturase
MKKALIIGSGIGGLAIAIRLAAKGFQVEIIEKSSKSGGKMNEFELDGFRFDTGPSLFTLPVLIDELFSLHGKTRSDFLEVKTLEMTCKYFFSDGMVLNAWSSKNRFIQEIESLGFTPKSVEKYLDHQSFIYRNTSDFFLFHAIHRPAIFIREAIRQNLSALFKMQAFRTMNKANEQAFGNSNLTQLFNRYATYNGSDPYRAPATLNMIAHLEHNEGAYFPQNGMYGIIHALEELAISCGIIIHYNQKAKNIRFTGNRVTGVETQNGFHPADLIINDTDISYFYKHLLPDQKKLKRLSQRERSSSALIFYWGMNVQSNLDVHNILFSEDYPKEFEHLFTHKNFAQDLTVYIFISSKINPEDAPADHENWFVMVNAPEDAGQDWEQEIPQVREHIIGKIKQKLGIDVPECLLTEKILSPPGIEQNTSSAHGSLYGHSSNSAFSAFLRHPNFSRDYTNLYFVGGSVHPGGGIPLCLAGAKIVDSLIEKDHSFA